MGGGDDRRPAVGTQLGLVAEVRARVYGDRLRLDAGPRRPPTPGGGSRFRSLRPRGLAGAAIDREGVRRGTGLGHAWLHPTCRPIAPRHGTRSPWLADRVRGRVRRAGGRRMKAFADLYAALDATTKTSEKVDALARYFAGASAADAAWAVYFLSGRKPRQAVPTRKLLEWGAEVAGIPGWLFDESHDVVGDLAEAIALVLPTPAHGQDRPLAESVEQVLLTLRAAGEERAQAE